MHCKSEELRSWHLCIKQAAQQQPGHSGVRSTCLLQHAADAILVAVHTCQVFFEVTRNQRTSHNPGPRMSAVSICLPSDIFPWDKYD